MCRNPRSAAVELLIARATLNCRVSPTLVTIVDSQSRAGAFRPIGSRRKGVGWALTTDLTQLLYPPFTFTENGPSDNVVPRERWPQVKTKLKGGNTKPSRTGEFRALSLSASYGFLRRGGRRNQEAQEATWRAE